jgi:serine/threonine protein kinase
VFTFTSNEETSEIEITMDFVGGGTLASLIDYLVDGFDLTQKFIIAFVMLGTISFLHSHNCIHRDLKTENWLINENLLPVLVDFGWAKSVEGRGAMTYQTGTAVYNPPEIITEEKISEYRRPNLSLERQCKIDVYTLGMVLYELFTGQIPFANENHDMLPDRIVEGERPIFLPGDCGDFVVDLCDLCWKADLDDRPTMGEVTEKIVRLGSENGEERFELFVSELPAMVERSQNAAFEESSLHGRLVKLERCARLGLVSAINALEKVMGVDME